ncbi:MAG: electron transfer flavoprotein subunit alpha/FixB family protein [Desulfobacterales bacterium]|jgi:electron transfer flavoprotein alpha subunit|nr:electron transfer flavoprotein subunit alpha/FixB family protein [Desulfobacterales bacterium]
MAKQFFAYITYNNGKVDDSALELLAAAKKMDAGAAVTAVLTGNGGDLDAVCKEAAGAFAEVWKIDNAALADRNGAVVQKALANLLPAGSIVLIPHEHLGMDVAPGLSVNMNATYVADVVGVDSLDGDTLKLVRQEYSGQVSTHVACDVSAGAVITIRPGSFVAAEAAGGGQVVDKSGAAGDLTVGRKFIEMVEAEKGDVDITASEILVAVGRGVEDEENLEIVNELAKAMGGDVCCSRPIVDAKWLDKSRQVGTSGLTVKPKVYLALGISGSFQHVGGIKGNPYIVAVNKNAKAPIFQIADVGVVQNLLEFVPELTEKVKELK